MKTFLDFIFRGTIFMAPKYALLPILFGCIAAFGTHNEGWTRSTGVIVSLVGVALGVVSVLYTVSEERKEADARNKE